MGYYNTAQICQNGHIINSNASGSPERNKKYCSKCGAQTITKCNLCSANIRGAYVIPSVISNGTMSLPLYCYECGGAYPWTSNIIKGVEEIISMSEGLNDTEKAEIKSSVPALVNASPAGDVAAVKLKQNFKKIGESGISAIRSLVVDVLSETAKKILFP